LFGYVVPALSSADGGRRTKKLTVLESRHGQQLREVRA
jgi:hypothetical protein